MQIDKKITDMKFMIHDHFPKLNLLEVKSISSFVNLLNYLHNN
jgi:hypothetical protein